MKINLLKNTFLGMLIGSLIFTASTYAGKLGPLEMEVHAIGQGNCITIKVPSPNDNEEPEYAIVDLGTSSYTNEKAIFKKWRERELPTKVVESKEEEEFTESPPESPTKMKISLAKTPESIESKLAQPRKLGKKSDQKNVREKAANKLIRWLYADKIKGSFKEFLKDFDFKSHPKIIKTILITHPDADHNNLLEKLLVHEYIRVENLILGGLPKRYAEKRFDIHFNAILKANKDAKIFFTATGEHYKSGMELNKDADYAPFFSHPSPKQQEEKRKKLLQKLKDIAGIEDPTLQEKILLAFEEKPTEIEKTMLKAFEDGFSFKNKGFKVWCLAANALHINGTSGKNLRIADDSAPFRLEGGLEETEEEKEQLYNIYNNADSIVLKIEYGGRSAILTGDATGIVTNRIANSYAFDTDFLKTDVKIASHHGSSSHGSNNKACIRQMKPRYVLISNGTLYGHPYIEAYNAFKSSPRMEKNIQLHPVLVTRSKNKTYDARYTHKGIFSTLVSGNILVMFPPAGHGKTEDVIEDIIKEKIIAEKTATESKNEISTKKVKKGIQISLYKDSSILIEEEVKTEEKELEENNVEEAEDVKHVAIQSLKKLDLEEEEFDEE